MTAPHLVIALMTTDMHGRIVSAYSAGSEHRYSDPDRAAEVCRRMRLATGYDYAVLHVDFARELGCIS